MHRLFGFLVAALSALGVAAPAAVEARPVPLLWQVETADGRTHALLGSIHVMRAEDYPLAPAVEEAFARAGHVVFELDPTEATSPTTALRLATAAQAPAGEDLASLLGSDYASFERVAAAQGVPAAALRGMRPWFASLTLALSAASRAGLESSRGVDMVLMQRAREAGKRTSGLERADDQIRALSGAPLREQLAGLRRVVAEPARLHEDVLRLHALWRAGDADGLVAAVAEELAEQPETYRRINVERNRAWLPRVEALLRGDDDVLIVVGALHLVGDDGLVAALRERGWSVTRVVEAEK
ncbi:TraB/GumN family protein [Coralloluteibacterium thermophilus]|uniref:TraB/GumN family protein n=1 Tax=Coralloluteibacterium thermophilum TaxID=2707049 RepID=A0ABV9NNJ9_9GAMM